VGGDGLFAAVVDIVLQLLRELIKAFLKRKAELMG
jgi:hypothetical protein